MYKRMCVLYIWLVLYLFYSCQQFCNAHFSRAHKIYHCIYCIHTIQKNIYVYFYLCLAAEGCWVGFLLYFFAAMQVFSFPLECCPSFIQINIMVFLDDLKGACVISHIVCPVTTTRLHLIIHLIYSMCCL